MGNVVRCLEVGGSHCFVVRWGVMFGEVVGTITVPWLPVDSELALVFAVFEPVEAHIHVFGASGLDLVVGDSG